SEVHYFLAYGNHPAFLRINFSPPLQGGMIDLEYYGVSKYDLSAHPDFTLDALQRFFRSLGFHIQVENTRVHARYDKEHTPDLRSLCDRASEIFCLAPYLLDIDWTIGGLALDGEARQRVATAWAESFASWGVLPLRRLLTKNRQGIVERIDDTPAGRQEVQWSGTGPYRDAFRAGMGELVPRLFAAAEQLDPELEGAHPAGGRDRDGQLQLERALLTPLRKALGRGELTETPRGYERTSPGLYLRVSEAEQFARLFSLGGERLNSAAALAFLIGPLERFLSFRTVGTVGPYDVQSARLSLPDEDLGIHVLRGEKHDACAAFYTHGTVLYRRRRDPGDPWSDNAAHDVTEFLALLRQTNYPVPDVGQLQAGLPEEVSRIRENLARALPVEPRRPIPGERAVPGVRATPGRSVGRVQFSALGRKPEDFAGAILVTPALQPHDGPLLNRAAGVVSTGGGILSHAALLAAQFRKPAIIIAGRWESNPGRAPVLHYRSTEYDLEEQESHGYHTSTRTRMREREHVLREGDLVAIDTREDVLRVLGQESDTLAFHEELRRYGRASQALTRVTSEHDQLVLRGQKIRARHQIEKLFARLADRILTCHAIDELLEESEGAGRWIAAGERAQLLNLMLNNPLVASTAERHLRWMAHELRRLCEGGIAEARSRIPASRSVFEVLNLRLNALRASQSLDDVRACLKECDIEGVRTDASAASDVDLLARRRLIEIREEIAAGLEAIGDCTADSRCRHLLRQWEKTEALVDAPEREKVVVAAVRARLSESDARAGRAMAARTVLWPGEGGFELFDIVGWKAANLAEVGRIAGGTLVPPWFVVTDRPFRRILDSPRELVFPKGIELPDAAPSLGKAIEAILHESRRDLPQKASLIRSLWASVVLPEDLAGDVVAAYRRIGGAEPLVALRSSSREEDAEIDARAGEFDTFLFIHGEQALLQYLLRTWSGLWSDRALHTREMLGTTTSFAGGGVIVQQIVNSRVSGVLQTVNVARNDYREMVINAVAADQIIVSKEGDMEKGPLRFSYVTADKREYVVFNKRAGLGTIRCEAPYHKRLRPTLEYAELCELVAVAARLESSYGYPLDIEFALEGSRLWILQVRPVPTSHSLLQQTMQRVPLTHGGEAVHAIRGDEHHD
ncbi:MAG: phosphoenolpyruvate synthase, partial [Bacteroidetes bacterium]|nr:phosphoenolpyruvate synthase [Bacteroidota bacterium]